MADTPKKSADAWLGVFTNPFLVLGFAFIVMGIAFTISDSMRGTGFAFIPIGIVFIVLSMTAGKDMFKGKKNDQTPPPTDPAP